MAILWITIIRYIPHWQRMALGTKCMGTGLLLQNKVGVPVQVPPWPGSTWWQVTDVRICLSGIHKGGPSLAEHCSDAQDGNTPVRYSKVRWENYKTINVISICRKVGSAQIPSATTDADGHDFMDNCSTTNKLGILCAHSPTSRIYQLTPLETNMAIEPE